MSENFLSNVDALTQGVLLRWASVRVVFVARRTANLGTFQLRVALKTRSDPRM